MADDGGTASSKYSCKSASETLQWIYDIMDFLKPFRFFLDSHVINFFKDRMWKSVDKEWMECLRKGLVETLVQIPCGVIQVDALVAVIGSIARRIGANTIVDVGSGQGYLAQVLSFEHELSVVAIDAYLHHRSVTEARAK